MEVRVIENDIEKAIKKLKKKVQKDGVLKDVRMRRYYEKPSERRKRKRMEAMKKRKKALRLRKRR